MCASGFTPPQIRRCLSDIKDSVLRPPCLHAEKFLQWLQEKTTPSSTNDGMDMLLHVLRLTTEVFGSNVEGPRGVLCDHVWPLPPFSSRPLPLELSFWTKVACSNELAGWRLFCRCLLPHVQLRGRCPGSGASWTAVSQPYPAFASALALGVAREAGWCDSKRALDIPGCARCSHCRIGEASQPGPRRARRPREGDLEYKPVQSSATLSYEAKLWEDFVLWCSSRFSDCLLVFSLCPVLAVELEKPFLVSGIRS